MCMPNNTAIVLKKSNSGRKKSIYFLCAYNIHFIYSLLLESQFIVIISSTVDHLNKSILHGKIA